MLVRVERTRKVDSSGLAERFVRGGLWYARPGRVDPHAGRMEYQRSIREVLPLRGRPWRNPRVRRACHPTVRLLRANKPPVLVPGATRPARSKSWSLEGLAPLVGDPVESRVRHWRYRLGGSPRGLGRDSRSIGIPEVGVHLRQRSEWSPTGSAAQVGYSSFPCWGSRPRKQQDPLLFRREWSRRGGSSLWGGGSAVRPLGGGSDLASRRVGPPGAKSPVGSSSFGAPSALSGRTIRPQKEKTQVDPTGTVASLSAATSPGGGVRPSGSSELPPGDHEEILPADQTEPFGLV